MQESNKKMTTEKKRSIDFYMTQREVALALNISAISVCDIERAALKKLKKILDEKNIKLNDLVGYL